MTTLCVLQAHFMKPVAFKATPQLDAESSRALLKAVGHVHLSEKRRSELAHLASAARKAFARPITPFDAPISFYPAVKLTKLAVAVDMQSQGFRG
jgi:hypothetical protein